ncbi:hypothetical protein ACFV7Q_34555 [Streptomyces sp. NPDC059851]|uniref:hypothetical protein n=1 Tax=Streptomyces sp. NPDC059851 TaxID=3346971 RepID=UPI00365CE792
MRKIASVMALVLTAGIAVIGPSSVSAAAAEQSVTEDVWNESWWRPAGWNVVKIHRYMKADGHHYVTGYINAPNGTSAFYYDRSYNGGKTWESFVDRRYVNGTNQLPEKYNDGGVWYRVCGASEWLNNPYGNPQWGYNIACTAWY